jgi:hypothetical protein
MVADFAIRSEFDAGSKKTPTGVISESMLIIEDYDSLLPF